MINRSSSCDDQRSKDSTVGKVNVTCTVVEIDLDEIPERMGRDIKKGDIQNFI